MRKLIFVAAGIAVLATAGLGVARTLGPPKSAPVAATFDATNASRVETRTCATSDGRTITVSHGTYSGMATGDASLSGPITLAVHSTVDTTAGVGVLAGRLRIDTAGPDTLAALTGVWDHGKVGGLAAGVARTPRARLLGNVSADFTTAGGFTNGKIGGGTAGGSAIELGPTRCARTPREESVARGTVSAISENSITVAGLTCSMSGDLAAKANARLDQGDHAQILCRLVNGTSTLVRFWTKK